MDRLSAGSWEGSIMTDEHIDYLQRTQKLQSVELVVAHTPDDEHALDPRSGEHVVFGTHFLVGFGLPGSCFLRQFLEFYGLEPHHLGPNSVLYLACFATLCKVYQGFSPCPSFFYHFFLFHAEAHDNVPYYCSGAVVHRWCGWPLSKMIWKESFKKWQRTFLYIRIIGLGRYWVNLPPFADEPPIGENWNFDLRNDEIVSLGGRLQELKGSLGLVAPYLVVAFVSRQVLPLQLQVHQMCDMSGHKDPCRLSTVDLPLSKVVARVNKITNFQLYEEEWRFDMPPFHRGNRAPSLFVRQNTLDAPNPECFALDQDDSDAEDYDSYRDGHEGPKDPDTLEEEEEDDNDEEDEEEAADAMADRARTSRNPPDGSVRHWTYDDYDDDVEVLEAPPATTGMPRGHHRGKSTELPTRGLVAASQPTHRQTAEERRRDKLPAEGSIGALIAKKLCAAKGKAAPTAANGTGGPLAGVTSYATALTTPEAPATEASPACMEVHQEPPPKVMVPSAREPAAQDVSRSAFDLGCRAESEAAAAVPTTEVEELCCLLADVWGKRDEIAEECDRLGKDLGAERVVAASLEAEVEQFAGALQDEKAAKVLAQQASVASDKAATSLRAEVARLGEEATSVLNLFRKVENTFVACFPYAHARVERAVEALREEQHRAGCDTDVGAGWSVEEMAHACERWVYFVPVHYDRLQAMGQDNVRSLWPDQAEGVHVIRVLAWLEHAVDRFNAWRASAARGGARVALTFALSWYSSINLINWPPCGRRPRWT
ncbi:hypothetical protein D1007_24147 [Hordeum vulgare]|nr:hypothetical protein D1007_24147 [Hordeum vulgare]